MRVRGIVFTKYRKTDVPAHAHGRYRRDPLMLLMTVGYDALNGIDRFTDVPETAGDGVGWIDVVVSNRAIVARDQDVVAVTFAPPCGEALPAWSAGAHVDVQLPSGMVRQYSLCGDPADRSHYRIAVRLIPDGRGGSTEVHAALTVGTPFRIRLPRNAFPLAVGGFQQPTTSVRLIAGGIGITPILPMLSVLERVSMPWSLAYCGRTLASLPFLDELSRYGDRVTVHLDQEAGAAGARQLLGDLTGAPAIYTCGPPVMIDGLRSALADRPDVEFHCERFSAATVVDGDPFEMRLASTGQQITVGADRTALSAILDVRPNATYSCQQGYCRSCKVRVLDGTPEHRSAGLSQAELDAGYFLPCVSRAQGCLTLDL